MQVCTGGQAGVLASAFQVAAGLAAKPPLALAGTKRVLLQARDCASVRDSLDYVATWNSAQLVSEDVALVLGSLTARDGRAPSFSKL